MRGIILGQAGNVVPAPNATSRVIADFVKMRVGYMAGESINPPHAYFEIQSWSPELSKYKNSKLTIFANDTQLVFDNLEPRSSIGIAETFYLEIKFEDFLRLTSANTVRFEIGSTKIALEAEDILALNELYKRTKKLKLPVRRPGVIALVR